MWPWGSLDTRPRGLSHGTPLGGCYVTGHDPSPAHSGGRVTPYKGSPPQGRRAAPAAVGALGPPAPTTAAVPRTQPRTPASRRGGARAHGRRRRRRSPTPASGRRRRTRRGGPASATHVRWGRTAAASQAATSGARGWADGPSSVPASPAWKAPAQPPSRRQPPAGSPGARRAGPRRGRRPVASGVRLTEPHRGCRGASPGTASSHPKGM